MTTAGHVAPVFILKRAGKASQLTCHIQKYWRYSNPFIKYAYQMVPHPERLINLNWPVIEREMGYREHTICAVILFLGY